MSRGHNNIKRSEVSTTPILLKYFAAYNSSSFNENGITVNRGTGGQYASFQSHGIEYLNFTLVKQLYYQEYITGSYLQSSSYWDSSLQSTAASETPDRENRYLPFDYDGDANITILAIPRTVFGEQIARASLLITGSTFRLYDDGNGNVKDSQNNDAHVGNILYSQGVIVLTNLEYSDALIQP